MYKVIEFMIGKTLTSVEGATRRSEEITFTDNEGQQYLMYHEQDCCESVTVEEVIGDISDLIGNPLLTAETRWESHYDDESYGSYTYTFYEFATIKGSVTLRWCGSSNGYYSESVDFGPKRVMTEDDEDRYRPYRIVTPS